jgi:branched-chain amino acid aminotransferase
MNLILSNTGLMHESAYDRTSLHAAHSVYEVIRVIDGIPLFLDDHFKRLEGSIKIQGLIFQMVFSDFKQNLTELVRVNQKMEGNIKFVYSVAEGNIQWAFSFIPHSYPTLEDYRLGVTTDLLFAERQNPNAKVVQAGFRDEANQVIIDRKLYEVLLVDRHGMITEGSRSNVFFVKSDVFYTAPGSMVLVGITRQKVLDCIKGLGFQVVEQAVSKDEIGDFDAVFLTGTSPKVLPVSAIGGQIFDVQNNAVGRLMDSYTQLVQNYIRDEMCLSKG